MACAHPALVADPLKVYLFILSCGIGVVVQNTRVYVCVYVFMPDLYSTSIGGLSGGYRIGTNKWDKNGVPTGTGPGSSSSKACCVGRLQNIEFS